MKMTIPLALTLALAGPAVMTATAAPAPWYHWVSKSTAERVCSQTPLGPGWARADGPYRDARCEKRLPAK
jgi:hypothetical protein